MGGSGMTARKLLLWWGRAHIASFTILVCKSLQLFEDLGIDHAITRRHFVWFRGLLSAEET